MRSPSGKSEGIATPRSAQPIAAASTIAASAATRRAPPKSAPASRPSARNAEVDETAGEPVPREVAGDRPRDRDAGPGVSAAAPMIAVTVPSGRAEGGAGLRAAPSTSPAAATTSAAIRAEASESTREPPPWSTAAPRAPRPRREGPPPRRPSRVAEPRPSRARLAGPRRPQDPDGLPRTASYTSFTLP